MHNTWSYVIIKYRLTMSSIRTILSAYAMLAASSEMNIRTVENIPTKKPVALYKRKFCKSCKMINECKKNVFKDHKQKACSSYIKRK